MAFNWIEGDMVEMPIVWNKAEVIVDVDSQVELLNVDVEAITKGMAGYFDDIVLARNLTNDKLFASEKIYHMLPQIGGNTEKVVIGAIDTLQIKNVHIVPSDSIIGDDTNYAILKLRNKETNEIITTFNLLAGTTLIANLVYNFPALNDENAIILEGESATFEVENVGSGMTIPESLLIIEWDVV